MEEDNKSVNEPGNTALLNPDPDPEPATAITTPTQPTTPMVADQTVQTPLTPSPAAGAKKLRPKWFMPAILLGVLVLGSGAAAYVTVFQKTPEKIWKRALSHTADGIDEYLATVESQSTTGFKMNGSFKVESPIATDGSMEGAWNGTTGDMKLNIGAAGARVTAEVMTKAPEGSDTPDIYMKVDGLDGIDELLSSLGASSASTPIDFSSINGQWYFIDHTLIDQYESSIAKQDASKASLSREDVKAVTDKVMPVMRDRLFATDDKAVFTIAEKIASEEFEGTSTYKMKVQVNQAQFKDFVTALKDAIKGTKLEELLKAGQDDKTLEEIIDFEKMIQEIEDTDFSKAYAEVWVEANGGYVRNIRFYPAEGKEATNYLDMGMKYTGGDVFPLYIRPTFDEEGSKGTLMLGFEVNKQNGNGKMTFDIDMKSADTDVKASGSFSVENSSDEVKVDVPADAKNIFELMSGFIQNSLDYSFDQSTYPSNFDFSDLPIDDLELQ